MKRALAVFGAMLVLALIAQGGAEARRIYPRDEGPRDRSFLAFRKRLLEAARRRDRRFIYSIVAPDIAFTFGDGRGRRDFMKAWNEEPAGKLERELIDVLSLGGVWQGKGVFCAPYVEGATRDIPVEVEDGVILAQSVRVRVRPEPTAPVVAVLSYDVVRMDYSSSVPPNADHPTWVKVTLPSGKSGYVAGRYIRSVVDYRAYFQKRRGQWWMTVFIAGD